MVRDLLVSQTNRKKRGRFCRAENRFFSDWEFSDLVLMDSLTGGFLNDDKY